MPSHDFATALHLRRSSDSLDLVNLAGVPASRTLSAPQGLDGQLLYIRQTDLAMYANGRVLIQLSWGERLIESESRNWRDSRSDVDAGDWRQVDTVNV